MPYTSEVVTTQRGFKFIRIVATGVMTRTDAEQISANFAPGGRWHELPMLALTDKTTQLPAEVRRVFTRNQDPNAQAPSNVRQAVVVQSVVVRVTLEFIMKVIGHTQLRLFNAEADAMRWLTGETAAEAA